MTDHDYTAPQREARGETMSETTRKVLEEMETLLDAVRSDAGAMAFEEGSGRGDPAPTRDLEADIESIRALFKRVLAEPTDAIR